MSTTMQDLQDQIDNEIKADLANIVDHPRARQDRVSEIVDGFGFNNGELAELLDSDNSLGEVEDSGLLPENPTVWNIIEIALMEKLRSYASQEVDRQVKEYEEMKEEMEGLGFQTSYMPGPRPRMTYIYKELPKEDQMDSEKEGQHGRSIDPAVPSEQTYEDELFIKGGFKNDYEAFTWLEEHLEEVEAKL